ncbi:hypothetical protein KM908_20560 [Alkalihalobacillus clausii]|uniref:hypothetical protein n=1 Tax=Shouchella clausii TaxID=79880 RepID=UPI001C244108|nr:hypothetical protein [Shouchella clausii]MBU8598508.1 hypothetical protein [Shouchella clausii]
MDKLQKIMDSEIKSECVTEELKEALRMQYRLNEEDIIKYALSSSPEDNNKRLKLLGEQDLILRIISA